VLAFEPFDFADTFDLSSLSFFVLPKKEFRELGLGSDSSSSCSFVIRVGVAFLCCENCENSVSGGLGGLPSFVTFAERRVVVSTDFDRCFSSEPRSVDSGV
jgi:hypothetical protein